MKKKKISHRMKPDLNSLRKLVQSEEENLFKTGNVAESLRYTISAAVHDGSVWCEGV